MRERNRESDTSSDTEAFVAALGGQDAFRDQRAYDIGAPTYDASENVIANNASGGAGYFAEAHHTASLNIDANSRNLDASAERVGSTAFGSPDIVVDGVQYNPKFYQSASESYGAGAQVVGEGAQATAKYAGQTIIVPSDQLEQVQQLHDHAIQSAHAAGDVARVQALESIRYADHIDQGGAQSLPLSYAEAHQGAEDIRAGALPGYVGDDSTLLGNAGEGALLAAAIALATSLGPQLMSDVANTLRGKLTQDELVQRLQTNIASEQARTTAGWAVGRGGAAAAMTALDALDPFGAALLANLLVDVVKLSRSVNSGEVPAGQFGAQFMDTVKLRIGSTALTAGAFWLVGPLGLLAPIIVRRMVNDAQLQRQTLEAWKNTQSAFREEFESRIRNASLLKAVGQHYRSAQASSKASAAAATAITQDLADISKLVGLNPGASKPGGA